MASKPILVSASNARFYRSLYQLLKSVKRHNIQDSWEILVYDLGLTDTKRKHFDQHFAVFGAQIIPFEFHCYPDHVSGILNPKHVEARFRHGAYAWKPIIIYELLKKSKTPVLWMDSATVILCSLDLVLNAIIKHGQYVPYS
jgi:hypothetical protein